MNQKETPVAAKGNEAKNKYVQLSISDEGMIDKKIAALEKKIHQLLKEEQYFIAVDMSSFRVAPKQLIVLLVQTASQVRRLGGNIKLENVNTMVENNLFTFSPNTYLSLESTEKYALHDFGEKVDLDDVYAGKQNENNAATTINVEPEIKKTVEHETQQSAILPVLNSLKLSDDNKVRVNSSSDNLYQICDFILLRAKEAGFDEHELARIKVTVYEACLNVVEHAYYSNPDYWIDVYGVKKQGNFYIIIHDWGRSFDFNPNREYDVEMAVKERKTGGFGLHIIKRSVDEIYYLADQHVGNRLILIKKINS